MLRTRQIARQVVASNSDVPIVSITLTANGNLPTAHINKYCFVTSSPATLTTLTLPTTNDGKFVCVRNSSTNPFQVNSTTIPVGESRTFIRVSGAWVLM